MRSIVVMFFALFTLSSHADDIQSHIAKIENIAAMNNGSSDLDFSQKCLALLNYYESLVTKTFVQEGELSARTGTFKFTRADEIKNFSFLKMSQEQIQKEFDVMQKCLLTFNDLYSGSLEGFPPEYKTIKKAALVGVVIEKLGDRDYIIQKLSVTLNPLAKKRGQPVTQLNTRDSFIRLKSLNLLSENQQIHFWGLVTGSSSLMKKNGFQTSVPIIQEVSSKVVDAFLLRAAVLEESLSQMMGNPYICGLARGSSKESKAQILKLFCGPSRDFEGDVHRSRGFQLYGVE